MDYAPLGRTGLKVSRLCLGVMSFGKAPGREWALDEAEARPLMARALELGVNVFDTADYYSSGLSEEILGRCVAALANRHELVIATKVFAPMGRGPNAGGLSRKHIFEAVDASLKRLGTDYIDLYQIHRWDYDTPLEETLEALNDIVRAGKVRYLGASSMYAWQLMQALGLQRQNGWAPFVSMQNHYNLIYREEEREMMPLCISQGVGVIPWSPLARGFLAGRREATRRQQTDQLSDKFYGSAQDHAILEELITAAQEAGVTSAAMATAWLASRPGVCGMIAGPRSIEQLDALADALAYRITPEQVRRLDALYQPRNVVGLDPHPLDPGQLARNA